MAAQAAHDSASGHFQVRLGPGAGFEKGRLLLRVGLVCSRFRERRPAWVGGRVRRAERQYRFPVRLASKRASSLSCLAKVARATACGQSGGNTGRGRTPAGRCARTVVWCSAARLVRRPRRPWWPGLGRLAPQHGAALARPFRLRVHVSLGASRQCSRWSASPRFAARVCLACRCRLPWPVLRARQDRSRSDRGSHAG